MPAYAGMTMLRRLSPFRLCFAESGLSRGFFLLLVLAAKGEHLVASCVEALPDLFGLVARNGSDFLPQATEVLDLVHRCYNRLVVQFREQVFGLFAEENLLLQVVLASLFLDVELVTTAREEIVASITECFLQFCVIVTARSERNPFLLEVTNGVGELVGARAFGELANLLNRVLLFLLDICDFRLEFR